MPKDRLSELKKKSGESFQHDESDGLLEVIAYNPTEQQFFKFSQQVQAIQETLWQVQEKINQLKSQHEKILSSPTNQTTIREDVEKIVKSISQTMTKIGKNVKDLNDAAAKDFRKRKLSETEFRMICNAQSSLVAKFQTTWEDLCEVRSVYETKCKKRIQRQLEIAGYSFNDEDIESAMVSGISVFSKEVGECEAAKLALRDQEDRLHELLELEKSIQEMHDLFLELNLMVQCQGETIDRIEVDVTQAADKVVEGKECLDVARKKRNSFRKKKFVCISVLCVTLILVISITLAVQFG